MKLNLRPSNPDIDLRNPQHLKDLAFLLISNERDRILREKEEDDREDEESSE